MLMKYVYIGCLSLLEVTSISAGSVLVCGSAGLKLLHTALVTHLMVRFIGLVGSGASCIPANRLLLNRYII